MNNIKKTILFLLVVLPPQINSISCNRIVTQMTCIGDSITWGYNQNEQNNRMKEPYPTLLENKMSNLKVENLSECGASFANIDSHKNISFFSTLVPPNTKIISIMGGTNDYWFNGVLGQTTDKQTDTTCGSLNTLLTNIKNNYTNVFIFFITPIKMKCKIGPNDLGLELVDYVNSIKNVCLQNDVPVLDLYTLCNPEEDFNDPTSDKVHPSQKFVREKMFPEIFYFIQKNYFKS